jgi:hypothetical protein
MKEDDRNLSGLLDSPVTDEPRWQSRRVVLAIGVLILIVGSAAAWMLLSNGGDQSGEAEPSSTASTVTTQINEASLVLAEPPVFGGVLGPEPTIEPDAIEQPMMPIESLSVQERRVFEGIDHLEPTTRVAVGQVADTTYRVHPDEAVQRYEEAVAGRRFVCEATPAGTANLLGLDLAPDHAAAVSRMINRIARSLKAAGETRTMDQLRADVYLDLLQGKTTTGNGAGTAGRGVVDVHVDVETLARLSEAPGELAGFGPVIADIARQVVARQGDSEWRFTVTDPHSGMAVHTGVTRRRPTTSQRRMVETRDRCCVFPGCRMPAVDCDLDHRIACVDGGPTTVCNLTPLCRHHHVVKHCYRWRHEPLPGGDHRWTSSLGHTYTTSGKPP